MHWLQNKREEMSKDISCHLRALKLLFCYNREWALVGLTILMDSLSPFVVIYLSSMLLEPCTSSGRSGKCSSGRQQERGRRFLSMSSGIGRPSIKMSCGGDCSTGWRSRCL